MSAQSHPVSTLGLPIESKPVPATPRKNNNIPFDVLAIVAVTGLLVGVTDIFGAGGFSGLCLAIGAVFYGLALIVKVIEKAEKASDPNL